jgi:MFS family permease
MSKTYFKGVHRNIIATGITSFLTDTSTKMIYSVMPLFLMSLGASKTTISMIEGIAESTASLLKAVSGYWSDKIGRNKPFMILGYGITAVITPLYTIITLPVQVLIVRFTERLGKGLRTAPRDSLICSSISGKDVGKNFGFQKAMDNSGAILGPLLAFILLYFMPNNFSLLFLLATIPAILGVFFLIFGVKEIKSASHKNRSHVSLHRLPRRFYLFLLVVLIFSLGNSSDALLLIKTTETGIFKAYIPFVYMIFNATSVFLAIPIGKLSDRIGREKLIAAGFLVYAVTYFFFGRFCNIRLFVLLFILYGIYSALTDVSQKSFISDLMSKEMKGTGYGLYHAVLGITLLPASFIGGWMYDHINNELPFYFGAFMAALASLLMYVFFVRKGH